MSNDPKVWRLKEVQREMLTMGRNAKDVLRRQHAALEKIRTRWDLNDESKTKGKAEAWREFGVTAQLYKLKYDELRGERDRLIAELTAGHRQPGGTHEELLRQAAWNRLEKALDGIPDASLRRYDVADQLLRQAADTGDEATLQAARRELPAFLARHGEPMLPSLQVWLDVKAGPPEAAEARSLQVSAGIDLPVAQLAVHDVVRAASSRELPDVIHYPSGIDGQRVAFLTEEAEMVGTGRGRHWRAEVTSSGGADDE